MTLNVTRSAKIWHTGTNLNLEYKQWIKYLHISKKICKLLKCFFFVKKGYNSKIYISSYSSVQKEFVSLQLTMVIYLHHNKAIPCNQTLFTELALVSSEER